MEPLNNVQRATINMQLMPKRQKLRHSAAKVLQALLMFGVPLILSCVLIFITGIIYVARPYFLTKDFTRTTCHVTEYSIETGNWWGCSDGTDLFRPCLRIGVMYGISDAISHQRSIIMENEQALVTCDQCSYTFGKHGLLHNPQDFCESWRDDYDPMKCIEQFISVAGIQNTSYSCYFNPNKPSEVVKTLVVDSNAVIHTISWPVLLCMIYLLGLTFIRYDSKQLKYFHVRVQAELENKRKATTAQKIVSNGRTKLDLGRSLGVYHTELDTPCQHDTSMKRCDSTPGLLNQLQSLNLHKNCERRDETCQIYQPDLRHLDLAVTERNIDDLTADYSPVYRSSSTQDDSIFNIDGAVRGPEMPDCSKIRKNILAGSPFPSASQHSHHLGLNALDNAGDQMYASDLANSKLSNDMGEHFSDRSRFPHGASNGPSLDASFCEGMEYTV